MKKTAATLLSAFMTVAVAGESNAQENPPPAPIQDNLIQTSPLPLAGADLIRKHCGGELQAVFVEEEPGVLFCRSGRIQRYEPDKICTSLSAEVSLSEVMLEIVELSAPEINLRQKEISHLREAMARHCLSM